MHATNDSTFPPELLEDTIYPADDPLTRRFLHYIGHGVEQLLITFIQPFTFSNPLGELPFVCQIHDILANKP